MMMIRSQDRKKLYPLTTGLYYDSGTSIMMDLGFSIDGTGDLLLGKYESKARCLEILDDLQECFLYENPKVYEMPEK